MKIINKNKSGVIALMMVVIIGAAALVMAYAASFLSLGNLTTSYDAHNGSEVYSMSDGCVETAMKKFRLNPGTYTGETLNFSSGSCIISISGSGATRTITSTATRGNYTAILDVVISYSTGTYGETIVTVNSWTEREN
ncbi:MAG: hypothetical protein WCK37_04640 [Candidatus Falkowbacteria bacterium]